MGLKLNLLLIGAAPGAVAVSLCDNQDSFQDQSVSLIIVITETDVAS